MLLRRHDVAFAIALGAASPGLFACGRAADSGQGEGPPSATSDASPGEDAARPVDVDAQGDATPESAPLCASHGGTCTPGKYANCPPGTQPTEDIHADCLPANASRGFFCCVPAPPSPCGDGDRTDCFANGCETCWSAASTMVDAAPSCAEGRTCCIYACTD